MGWQEAGSCGRDHTVFGAGSHRLAVATLDHEAAQVIRAIGTKLTAKCGEFSSVARAKGVDRLAISLMPDENRPESQIATLYSHGSDAEIAHGIPALLSSVPHLMAPERAALEQLGAGPPAEQLFGWQDDDVARLDPGQHIASTLAIELPDDNAAKMRKLVQDMRAKHLYGLAARARAVGYFREAMALAPQGRGRWLYLLYLELKDPDMRAHLMAYPDTAFTSWWNPRFRALLPAGALGTRTEQVLSWRTEDLSG